MGTSLSLEAASDLLRRYGAAFRHAWQHRKEMEVTARLSHESQFLPAALALQETPVSPAPRIAMWLLIVFSVFAVLWAIFGRLDVVATAQGKTVPNDRVKTIQPLETAVVKQIRVTDGQNVKAGDVLLELDATATSADTVRLENDLTVARLDAARAEAFLAAIDGDKPVLTEVEGIAADRLHEAQRLLDGQWVDYKTKLDRIEADIVSKEAELRSTQEMVKKIETTLPIVDRRAQAFKGLYEMDAVSEQQYREAEKALLELDADWAATLQKLQSIQALHKEALKQKESLTAETKRTMLDSRHEALQKVTANGQELIKAQQRDKLMKLVTPVDGCVQQLAIHTVGGVVTPAQALMVIVPTEDPLEVEAFLENKDIGFVNTGQEAEVKIETFPYTKYGTIHGTVKQVSSDAIQDEKRGLIYSTRVKLDKTTVPVGDKTVNLTAGMAVTVEIKTDKRRVIEYFLTPLLQHSSESLRER